ncbi:apoptosis and caspase activation inhibitor [Arctopsyche grandis]|uniref:apoptosis and caspase activation inhibitor n=1 Tax=Arctopsyche grandis TaxID=121162 RepID=UPI00406D927A
MSEKNKKQKNQNQSQKKDDKQKNQNKIANPQKKNENKSKNIEKSSVKPVPVKETKIKNDPKTPISEAPVNPVNEQTSSRGKYSKRKVESNWSKLELPDNIYESIEDSARGANMGELLKKPISVGDHFQFKHEKFWNFDSKSRNDNDLFTLDMLKIASHISFIPFYERNELDPSLFSSYEIQWMKRTANMNRCSQNISDVQHNITDLKSFDVSETNLDSKSFPIVDNDELDEILNVSQKSVTDEIKNEKLDAENCPDTKNNTPNSKITQNDDDLEEWLNEYLK